MKAQQLPINTSIRFVLDGQDRFLEVNLFDDRLFFGVCPAVGQTPIEAAGVVNTESVEVIMQAVRRSREQKRNSYFEYRSEYAPDEVVYVGGRVEYMHNHLIGVVLNSLEVESGFTQTMVAGMESAPVLQEIYRNLPIGLEIYNSEGLLIEINECEMLALGIVDKESILGVNLFDNPNLPPDVKSRLHVGESVSFSVDYDFNLLNSYCGTTKQAVRRLDVSISVMRDAMGQVDKYLVISQDVTERIELQRENDNLYKQNITILNSLPVGVGLYSKEGRLLYANPSLGRTFDTDIATRDQMLLSIFDNPGIPESIMNAVRRGESVHTTFPYDFAQTNQTGYFVSSRTDIRQIECNGQPIFDADGQYQNYVFIMEDVTDATRQEEALRQSNRKAEIAMHASDIMLWEFDVKTQLFFSENEPLNEFDRTKPISIDLYNDTIHPEDRPVSIKTIDRMVTGEDLTFKFDARVLFPNNPEWQYCTISGSPYEKDDSGKVVKFVGFRKSNMEDLRRKMLQDKILNSIPLPIHIKDIEDNFRYVFCNEESKRMFGTSEEKTCYDVMDVQEVERIQKTDMEVFRTGEPYFGQERIVLNDGRSYDTIVRKSIIYDGSKRLLLNVRWDQSLQNDLQRRAKVLSITMEAMQAYMWIFEPGDNKIIFGEGFDKVRQSGEQVDSLEAFALCVHPEDRQIFIESITERLNYESGEWKVEYRADLNADGVYEWWETRGVLETSMLNDKPYKYMFGMSICIDKFKQTELTLLQNKEEMGHLIRQNDLVLNNTNSGLVFITTDYVVQWENVSKCSASLSYEAYKRGELCYKSAHNRTSPCENCVMQRAMKSHQVEQIAFKLDDNHVVEVIASPVINKDGVVDGIVMRMDDVTMRERMISELKQAKAQAEQSDKLKSAFLANMSHEIRTPLNAIVGFSDLLMSSTGEEREEYIRIINTNNELLLKLINDILDLSKIEAGSVELKYEDFDLSEYFNGMALSMSQRVKNRNVQLTVVNPYLECHVRLDRNRIAQILTNYVTNAIKYTPKGLIEMGYEYIDDCIRFYVKDTGIGIPDEKKSKVFHRFEKLDEFAQGTGLGLSICKAISESMGGEVGFESNYGEGSIFWAKLPCDAEITRIDSVRDVEEKESVEEVVAQERVEPVNADSRKTILVVEDIMSNYMLLEAMLKKYCNLIHAQNGREGVDAARMHHVDLVLMDMKMPVMDGLTATVEIRKFNTSLPIVALTAHAFESDRVAALEAGCNDYLVKPIDKSKLMSVLRSHGVIPQSGA